MSPKLRQHPILFRILLRKSMRFSWTDTVLLSTTISTLFLLLVTFTPPASATFGALAKQRRPPRHHLPPPPPGFHHPLAEPPRPKHSPHRLGPKPSGPPHPPHQLSRGGHRHGPPPPPPPHLQVNHKPHSGTNPTGDLHSAAQTLYDLRGFHIPLGGQEETQRFLRQQQHSNINDPFARPNNNNNGFNNNRHSNNHNNDPRTAPLVFPSFYQQQPTAEAPKKSPLNIFGHSQHLSQTKYEPAGQSESGSGPSGGGNFRPSQVDVGFNNPPPPPRGPPPPAPPPPPQALRQSSNQNFNHHQLHNAPQHQQHQPELSNHLQGRQVGQGQQILNYRAPELNNQQRPLNNNQNQNQNIEDPFVYVYDDEDYDEGEDDFIDKPQQQINTNRVTTPRPPAPLPIRTQAPIVHSTPAPPHRSTTPKAKPVTTTTAIPISIPQQGHLNDFFTQQGPTRDNFFFNNNNNNNDNQFFHSQQPTPNYIPKNQSPAPPLRPSPTPRPNVEINPSSERKPPPDQSNAIIPVLKQNTNINNNNNINNNQRDRGVVNDDRFRRPSVQQVQQDPQQIFYDKPQQNNRPNQRDPFNQVVNLNEEEEEQIYEQDPELIQKLNPFGNTGRFQEPPSRLRPVNTIVPKNRVPQQDIILPHNFPFHNEEIDNTQNEISSTLGPGTRGDVIRNNHYRPLPTTTTASPEAIIPTQQQRVVRPQNQNQVPQTHNQVPQTHNQVPQRVRGNGGSPGRTTTTPTTTSEPPKRIRNRVRPNRLTTSLATTTTTTTTTTTRPTFRTTSQPPSYDETSQEYYEDYNHNAPPRVVDSFEQLDRPNPSIPNKSTIRPIFNNQIQELQSPRFSPDSPRFSSETPRFSPETPRSSEPPRRIVRPTPTTIATTSASPITIAPYRNRATSSSGNNSGGGRNREQTTIESPPSKTTTGKPLYYAGKMLSKEGGLYAGQTIPIHHVYGQPVPNIPINSVFDKVPAALETVAPARGPQANKNNNLQQQRIRGGQQTSGRISHSEVHIPPPTRIPLTTVVSPHSNSRLVHPSRVKPAISQATTPQPPPPESQSNIETFRERPQPRPQSPKFLRPQSVSSSTSSTSEPDQSSPQPPRRRKVRPGQKQRPGQNIRPVEAAQHQTTEVVSVRESVSEESSPFIPEEPSSSPRAPRPHRLRPQPTQPITTTTEEPPSSSPLAKLRARRPRPNKIHKISEAAAPVAEEEEQPRKPVRKLRPRPRPGRLPLQHSTPQPEFSESVSIVKQSSVKVARKPTEAPGRFSSRFRDDSSSTIISSTQSTSFDTDVQESSSPSSPFPSTPSNRPTLKPLKAQRPGQGPPGKPKRRPQPQRKQQEQPNPEDAEDALPASIRLSAKDVVLNRKPARRIPPGSASDRLKALQERRKNKAANNRNLENEDDNEEAPAPQGRAIRRRKLQAKKPQRQQPQEEEDYEPQQYDNQPDPPNQNKREITSKTATPQKIQNSLKEYDDGYDQEDEYHTHQADPEDEEYDALEKERQEQVANRQLQIPANRAAARNPSEVTSDEARTVLGIQRPQQNQKSSSLLRPNKGSNTKPKPLIVVDEADHPEEDHGHEDENYYGGTDDDDYEGHHSQLKPLKVSTELPPSSTAAVVVRRTESTMQSSSDAPSTTYRSTPTYSTSTSTFRTPLSTKSSSNLRKIKPFNTKGSSSVVTSTSTSASTSVSSESTTIRNNYDEDEEELSSSAVDADSLNPATTASSLKARLRPNKKLLETLQKQPRLTSSQQREKNQSARQSNLSKLLRLKTSSSTYSPISSDSSSSSSSSSSTSSSNKLFTMATEDPSLPLESIFPIVNS